MTFDGKSKVVVIVRAITDKFFLNSQVSPVLLNIILNFINITFLTKRNIHTSERNIVFMQ